MRHYHIDIEEHVEVSEKENVHNCCEYGEQRSRIHYLEKEKKKQTKTWSLVLMSITYKKSHENYSGLLDLFLLDLIKITLIWL